jgi:hypothetical protein
MLFLDHRADLVSVSAIADLPAAEGRLDLLQQAVLDLMHDQSRAGAAVSPWQNRIPAAILSTPAADPTHPPSRWLALAAAFDTIRFMFDLAAYLRK